MPLLRGLIIFGIVILGLLGVLMLWPSQLPSPPTLNPALKPEPLTQIATEPQTQTRLPPLENIVATQASCEQEKLELATQQLSVHVQAQQTLQNAINNGLSLGTLQALKQELQPYQLWQISRATATPEDIHVEPPDIERLVLVSRLKSHVEAEDWDKFLTDIENGTIDLSYSISNWVGLPGLEIDYPEIDIQRTLGVMLMLDRGNRFPSPLLEAIAERYRPNERELISLLIMDANNDGLSANNRWLIRYQAGVTQGDYDPDLLLKAAAQQGNMELAQQAFELGATIQSTPDEATPLEHALAGYARSSIEDKASFEQQFKPMIELLIEQGDSAAYRLPDEQYDHWHLWGWGHDLSAEMRQQLEAISIPQRDLVRQLSGEQLQRLQLLRNELAPMLALWQKNEDALGAQQACEKNLAELLQHSDANWQKIDSFEILSAAEKQPIAEEALLDKLYVQDPSLVDARLISQGSNTALNAYEEAEPNAQASEAQLLEANFITLLEALQQEGSDWSEQLAAHLEKQPLSNDQIESLYQLAYSRMTQGLENTELSALISQGYQPTGEAVLSMVSFNRIATLKALQIAGLDLNSYHDDAGRPLGFLAIQNGYPELAYWLVEQSVIDNQEPRASDPLDALLERLAEGDTDPRWVAQMPLLLRQIQVRPSHLNRMAALKYVTPIRYQQIVKRHPTLEPFATSRPLRIDGVRW
ncbi:hypothetical protein DU002_09830 [Corallincola holothuriorum]|uniref:Ankyrin repeat domain-containing protein n=1 Tax=Corallincola holothuriorum TaxID=2282215 RepID=A0A368NH50_9GAMM|nr:hypothetical protein [Corallincola holothuriorum]RCU49917.1 hypothetical protein DU002_09830 [Corallincola holothuriorum]